MFSSGNLINYEKSKDKKNLKVRPATKLDYQKYS